MTINIIPYHELDTDTRWTLFCSSYAGYDPITKAYLCSSSGHRKAGRPTRYFAKHGDTVVRFTAHSIDEAIDKANRGLNAAIALAKGE